MIEYTKPPCFSMLEDKCYAQNTNFEHPRYAMLKYKHHLQKMITTNNIIQEDQATIPTNTSSSREEVFAILQFRHIKITL